GLVALLLAMAITAVVYYYFAHPKQVQAAKPAPDHTTSHAPAQNKRAVATQTAAIPAATPQTVAPAPEPAASATPAAPAPTQTASVPAATPAPAAMPDTAPPPTVSKPRRRVRH